MKKNDIEKIKFKQILDSHLKKVITLGRKLESRMPLTSDFDFRLKDDYDSALNEYNYLYNKAYPYLPIK